MAANQIFQEHCRFHGKRSLEFVCIELQCEIKEKRGCNLCFMKNGKHQDHSYLESSDLMEEINSFQVQDVTEKIKQKAKSAIIKINQELDDWYLKVVQKCEEIETKYEEIGDIDSLIEVYRIKKNEQILPIYQGIDMYQEDVLKNMKNAQNYINYFYHSKYLEQLSRYQQQIDQLKQQFQEIYVKNPLREQVNAPFNFDMEELENNIDSTLHPQLEQIKLFDQNGNPYFKAKSIQLCQKKDNLPNGRMFYFRDTGELYEGYILNNQKHGKGKLVNQYGHVYVGEFRFNKKHGQGVYLFGQYKYEGEFQDNKYHGYGKMIYQNGDIFEGFYRYGMRHGKGKFTYCSGKEKIGVWADDKYVSEGTIPKDEPQQN
ncbi:hypothetical protein ABPG74_018113 [Tetrahymena malaccensis]